jgi:sporulation protein YlmC with PRC-barrel domain
MKTQSRNIAPWMAALLCLALAPATKATDEADATKASTAQETSSTTPSNEGAPAKCNKASSILGMDVRNQKDEHLGHIKDLVIDWKTEGVSYAVISTAPKAFLGINEKLLAVPLSALTVGSDQKCLVLNADKSKVETAMGFDRDNWPSVGKPSWGAEPFWQKEADKSAATEAPAPTPEATATPGTMPESKPDMKPSQDPESPPDMENESRPEPDPEANQDTDSDGK